MAAFTTRRGFDHVQPDGYTEIDLPSERLLRAFFDTQILEPSDEPQPRIIHADDYFRVRFRLELKGELWYCICGDWWFDLGFAPTGAGKGFDLSNLLGREKFYVRNWRGCETRCIELVINVPPGTIPVEYCGTVYKCAAKVQLYCCGRSAAVVGFDDMGTFSRWPPTGSGTAWCGGSTTTTGTSAARTAGRGR